MGHGRAVPWKMQTRAWEEAMLVHGVKPGTGRTHPQLRTAPREREHEWLTSPRIQQTASVHDSALTERAPGGLLTRGEGGPRASGRRYRQAELLEGRLDEGGVLRQDLLQVPAPLHVPENCSDRRKQGPADAGGDLGPGRPGAEEPTSALPLRDSLTSESVSTKRRRWNMSRIS